MLAPAMLATSAFDLADVHGHCRRTLLPELQMSTHEREEISHLVRVAHHKGCRPIEGVGLLVRRRGDAASVRICCAIGLHRLGAAVHAAAVHDDVLTCLSAWLLLPPPAVHKQRFRSTPSTLWRKSHLIECKRKPAACSFQPVHQSPSPPAGGTLHARPILMHGRMSPSTAKHRGNTPDRSMSSWTLFVCRGEPAWELSAAGGAARLCRP